MSIERPYMVDIPVNNRELLDILEGYSVLRKTPDFEKNIHISCEQDRHQRHWWTGAEYCKKIVDEGSRHEGFPDSLYGYEMSVGRKGHNWYSNEADAIFRKKFTSKLSSLNQGMMTWLGVKHNALTAIYPPGGYISWHTNANASAYNLIFSYSETGDGYFEYIDPITRDVVRMPDKKGWNCKAAYFGHYGEPEKVFYHAASTNCWRCTVSYTFNTTDTSFTIREDLIEDIMSIE